MGTNAYAADVTTTEAGAPRVLLFSKTAGFRHGSINAARSAISNVLQDEGIEVDTSEDASVFTSGTLDQYDAVVFMLTSGDILNSAEQAAFEDYIRAGNGYAGIHSASDTEYNWPWYGDLIGAWFDSHPNIQEATVNIEITDHPSTETLPVSWVRTDEWYNFRTNPRASVNVLATLDEDSYNGGNMGSDHPIAWFHEFDGGRSWYTGGGHRGQSYSEPEFMAHLLGGILYAAGLTDTDPDSDGDGVGDSTDNCTQAANTDQRDSNNDGLGNACDMDLNNDCTVNVVDLGILRSVFFTDDADADSNGDSIVNAVDLGAMRAGFFADPGPAATPNDCAN
ncbi:MAG: ThuA domain-containing protein [Gammaproteobacteria bacterium]